MLGVVQDSMEYADMKDGNTVDVDSEDAVLEGVVAVAVAVVGVDADADGLLEAGEVWYYQMPRPVVQRDLVLCFATAQKRVE